MSRPEELSQGTSNVEQPAWEAVADEHAWPSGRVYGRTHEVGGLLLDIPARGEERTAALAREREHLGFETVRRCVEAATHDKLPDGTVDDYEKLRDMYRQETTEPDYSAVAQAVPAGVV